MLDQLNKSHTQLGEINTLTVLRLEVLSILFLAPSLEKKNKIIVASAQLRDYFRMFISLWRMQEILVHVTQGNIQIYTKIYKTLK